MKSNLVGCTDIDECAEETTSGDPACPHSMISHLRYITQKFTECTSGTDPGQFIDIGCPEDFVITIDEVKIGSFDTTTCCSQPLWAQMDMCKPCPQGSLKFNQRFFIWLKFHLILNCNRLISPKFYPTIVTRNRIVHLEFNRLWSRTRKNGNSFWLGVPLSASILRLLVPITVIHMFVKTLLVALFANVRLELCIIITQKLVMISTSALIFPVGRDAYII